MHSQASRPWWYLGWCLFPFALCHGQSADDVDAVERFQQATAARMGSGHEDGNHRHEHVHHAYAQVLNVMPVYESLPPVPSYCLEPMPTTHESDDSDDGESTDTPPTTDEPSDRDAENGLADDCLTQVDAEPLLVGYDVEYRYRGEVFISRLNAYPGDRLRIRVAITPAELIDSGLDVGATADDFDQDDPLLEDVSEDVPGYPLPR